MRCGCGLFGPESDDRVNTQRAARGDDAGDERDEQKQNRERGEGEGIGRGNTVEQTGKDTRAGERVIAIPAKIPAAERLKPCRRTRRMTSRSSPRARPGCRSPRRCSGRNQHAKGQLRRGERNAGEDQSRSVLKRCSASDTAITSDIGRMFVTGINDDFQIAAFSCLTSPGSRSRHFHHQLAPAFPFLARLRVGRVDRRLFRGGEPEMPHVPDHADDRDPVDALIARPTDPLADRVLVREITLAIASLITPTRGLRRDQRA